MKIITCGNLVVRLSRYAGVCGLMLVCAQSGFSQHEYDSWAFGNRLGVRFTDSGVVTTVTGIDAPASCSSIGDASGSLLLYSNGETVWNGRNEILNTEGTLDARKDNFQSAIFTKMPGSTNLYFLFTTGGKPLSQNAVRFHIVDVSADSGKGRIISQDNELLVSSTQNIGITYHKNRRDLWLVVFDEGKILSYLIQESGIGPPVVSINFGFRSTGSISISPLGNLIAIPSANASSPLVQILEFNNSDGTTAFRRTVAINKNPGFSERVKDVAFSVTGSRLYVSLADGTGPKNSLLLTFNMDSETFPSSFFNAGSHSMELQLGPNGKMYLLYDTFHPVSNRPSVQLVEIACDRSLNFIDSRDVFIFEGSDLVSLPSFNESAIKITADLNPGLPPSLQVCANLPYQFSLNENPGVNYQWTPSVGLSNTNVLNPTLTLSQVGSYVYYLKSSFPPTCALKIDTMNVTVNPSPSSPRITFDTVCSGEEGAVATLSNNNHQYSWSVVGGTIKQGQGTATVVVDWDRITTGVVELLVKNEFGCPWQTRESISLRPLPVAMIKGSPIVCPHVKAVDYNAEPATLSYGWSVNGGNIVKTANDKIQVDWGASNDHASVSAIAFDEVGCKSDPVSFSVLVKRELKPSRPAGLDSVCLNFSTGVSYSTSYTNGSVYTWMVSNGSVSGGQGTNRAFVSWPGVGSYRVWVSEESTTETDYCKGYSDTLFVKVYKDSARITMDFVSTEYDDDSRIKIKWQADLISRISDLIVISRRRKGETGWTEIKRVSKLTDEFLDQTVDPGELIYEYKIAGFNRCDEGLETLMHNNVLLAGEGEEESGTIDLRWNSYVNWEKGVDHYEIWRKLDNSDDFELIDVVDGNRVATRLKNGIDGFRHTLKIKAKEVGKNVASWSNQVEVEFKHDVFVPNVITVNGDGLNEKFIIPRLDAYKQNMLKIFNRYGENVYTSSPYEGTWDGGGLSAGVYYYTLQLSPLHEPIRGWVELIR